MYHRFIPFGARQFLVVTPVSFGLPSGKSVPAELFDILTADENESIGSPGSGAANGGAKQTTQQSPNANRSPLQECQCTSCWSGIERPTP